MANNNDGNKGMVFMGMGFELVIMVLGAAYLGKIIDDHFHWQGYASATLILVFLVSWFYHLIFLIRRVNEDDADDGS